jgi:hypothetical protein
MPDDAHQTRSTAEESTGKHRAVDAERTGRYVPIPVRGEAQQTHIASPGEPAIPGYDIVGELGRGGTAVVYKAWQVSAKRFVALKTIVHGADVGQERLRRFRTEAKAVARVSHSNIIQVHEVGEHEGRPFVALEFCAGGSLAKKLAGSPITAQSAAALTEKLARAIAAAHQAHVIHRDLKPANVLIADDEPKIGDFGLAKCLDSDEALTGAGAVIGTPSYMPPEQATGQTKLAGPTADIYGLGAILYECLTGRPPFKGATILDTVDQVRYQEPVSPQLFEAKIPSDLVAICLKCLSKNPANRYGSALQLADDLKCFLDGRPISVKPAGRWARTVQRAKRNLAAIIIATAVAIGLAICIFALWSNAVEARKQAQADRQSLQDMVGAKEAQRLERERVIRLYREYGQWRLVMKMELPSRAIAVGFSSDHRYVLARLESDPQTHVWDVSSGEPIVSSTQPAPPDGVEAVSDDGRLAVSAHGLVLEVRERHETK